MTRGKDWLLTVIGLAFVVVGVWMDLTVPDYMSKITVLVETEGSTMGDVLTEGAKMLAYSLGSLGASVVVAICAALMSADCAAMLRGKMFRKVQSFSMKEIGEYSTDSLITRTTNDVVQIQMFIVLGFQMLARAPIMAVWAVAKIWGKAWQWTLTTGVVVVVLLTVVGVCVGFALPKFRRMQALIDNLNRVTRENLSGLRVVRAYNAEGYQEDKSERANAELTANSLSAQHAMAFLMPSIQLGMNSLMLAIYWVGGVIIDEAGFADRLTQFSNMIVFTQYAIQVVMSFLMLVMIFMLLPRAQVAAQRINEVLDTPLSLDDGEVTEGKPGLTGDIEFRNVSFAYPDAQEPVIDDISFTAHKGDTVALIGATGCGKSSIVNLIPRFYDATGGEVLVDGVNVRDYSQKALRNKIGYISQKATLFSGTIASNVAYGDNGRGTPTRDEIESAVATAQADEFVSRMADGVDSDVAQGGSNLSGGQKQRVSIARAIARKPEILIFDDSFSALDYKTDRVLRDALDRECGDTTRIIVAQRIGTIRDADQILVIDDGRIVGRGTHDELLETCDTYRQIAESQLSKEEM
ncbi:MAG: ABC transporter ATP-binding protein [Bifidobacteriaceae bacterium]|nr:ABC transporter ATP-binding protein [Bifidobacteriaceae bacterium]